MRFTERLNTLLASEAEKRSYLLLNDVHYLSARMGLDRWYDPARWFSYKLVTTPQASAELAFNLSALIAARYGLSRKVLVLDLDNTVWGGVIGDDGPDGIAIGRETPRAEAFTHFQEYAAELRRRGIEREGEGLCIADRPHRREKCGRRNVINGRHNIRQLREARRRHQNLRMP